MTRIGVIVEGPSDQIFWSKLLWRVIPGFNWDVRPLHGRPKVFAGAANLETAFRRVKAAAVMVLVDGDDDPCATVVRNQFPLSLREAFTKASHERDAHLFVAFTKLESWMLADEEAIRTVTNFDGYESVLETSTGGSKAKLREILRSYSPGKAFNEIAFAKEMSRQFSPERAKAHSASFSYFWNRLATITQQLRSDAQ